MDSHFGRRGGPCALPPCYRARRPDRHAIPVRPCVRCDLSLRAPPPDHSSWSRLFRAPPPRVCDNRRGGAIRLEEEHEIEQQAEQASQARSCPPGGETRGRYPRHRRVPGNARRARADRGPQGLEGRSSETAQISEPRGVSRRARFSCMRFSSRGKPRKI